MQEKEWDGKEDGEDLQFLREEKKVYLEIFPEYTEIFEGDDKSEDDDSIGSEDGLKYSLQIYLE